jgi:RHS Repeat
VIGNGAAVGTIPQQTEIQTAERISQAAQGTWRTRFDTPENIPGCRTDRNGNTITYVYDNLNRMTSKLTCPQSSHS